MQNPPWLARLLAEGRVYEVGGPVRDRLMGLPLGKDRDYLVCKIPLDRLQSILRESGSVNLVGKSFGVLKFQPRDGGEEAPVYDIALPRAETSTGTGHRDFTVEHDPNLPVEKDLLRRDFTINAIAQDCESGKIVDPSNGRKDIEERLLRMVFPGTFHDDPLRILRGAQFVARFGLTVELATREAMKEAAPLITTVSLERVSEELTKLLTLAPKPSLGLLLLQELGIIGFLLPELEKTVGVDQPGGYHAWPVFEHSLYTVDAAPVRLRVRLAALFHDINKPQCKAVEGDKATFYGHEKLGARTTATLLRRLRFPHELADEVALLVERHMFTTDVSDKGLRRLIRWLGPDLVFDLLDLRRADVVAQGKGGRTDDVDELEARIREEINKKSPFGLKDLAVNGSDIIQALGLTPGPAIGRILNHLLETVLDDPSQNDRDILLREARNYLSRNE